MLRLLDRYLLRELMMPLGACLGGFFIFWTAFNLLGDLPEFQRQHLRPLDVCAHTLAGIPEQLNTVLPVGLLLGLLYALTQLTRHHELTAMRAAGISLFRVVLPYLVLGLLCSLGLFALNEYVWPDGSERQDRILHRHDTPEQQAERLWKKGLNYQGPKVRWNIGAIHQETGELRTPRVWQPLPSDARWVFSTDRLRWVRGAWRPVTNLLEALGRTATDQEPLKRFTSVSDFPMLSATPDEVLGWKAEPWPVDHVYSVWVTNSGVRTNLMVHTNVVWRTNLVVPPGTNGVTWRVRAYDPVLQELHGVRVTVPALAGSSRVTYADAGYWDAGRWVLRQVTDVIYRGPKDSDPLTAQLRELPMPELDQSWEMLRSELRVGQFNQKKVLRGAKLTMAEIDNYRRLHPEIPRLAPSLARHPVLCPMGGSVDLPGSSVDRHSLRGSDRTSECVLRGGWQSGPSFLLFCPAAGRICPRAIRAGSPLAGCVAAKCGFWFCWNRASFTGAVMTAPGPVAVAQSITSHSFSRHGILRKHC